MNREEMIATLGGFSRVHSLLNTKNHVRSLLSRPPGVLEVCRKFSNRHHNVYDSGSFEKGPNYANRHNQVKKMTQGMQIARTLFQ